jgi:hypothetical protein
MATAAESVRRTPDAEGAVGQRPLKPSDYLDVKLAAEVLE